MTSKLHYIAIRHNYKLAANILWKCSWKECNIKVLHERALKCDSVLSTITLRRTYLMPKGNKDSSMSTKFCVPQIASLWHSRTSFRKHSIACGRYIFKRFLVLAAISYLLIVGKLVGEKVEFSSVQELISSIDSISAFSATSITRPRAFILLETTLSTHGIILQDSSFSSDTLNILNWLIASSPVSFRQIWSTSECLFGR